MGEFSNKAGMLVDHMVKQGVFQKGDLLRMREFKVEVEIEILKAKKASGGTEK